MGLFKRLHRITVGRVEAFLSRAEDPEVLLPQLLREMDQQFTASVEAEGKARAGLKRMQRAHQGQVDKIARLQSGAVAALKAGDDATARLAVEAQIDAEKTLEMSQENLDRTQDTVDHAVAARKHIQGQLEELRARKDEILTRARIARVRKSIQQTVSGSVGSTDSILDGVARLEAGVEEIETQLEIQAQFTGDPNVLPSLERRLKELDSDAEVEKRLVALRQTVAVVAVE